MEFLDLRISTPGIRSPKFIISIFMVLVLFYVERVVSAFLHLKPEGSPSPEICTKRCYPRIGGQRKKQRRCDVIMPIGNGQRAMNQWCGGQEQKVNST